MIRLGELPLSATDDTKMSAESSKPAVIVESIEFLKIVAAGLIMLDVFEVEATSSADFFR